MSELDKLREQIDKWDENILELLNKRTKVVLKIKKAKEAKHLNRHSPEREKHILERLKKLNTGPFPNDALYTIYREILSASLSIEQPLKIAYLGPSATFTHLAAQRKFGSSAHYLPKTTIKAVFEAVYRENAQYGVVPIENSTEGMVNYTLDMFMDSDLKISSEIMLEISHNLLSKTGTIHNIKKIYSYPQATAQCRGWLEQNLPGIPIIEEVSTAAAARRVSEDSTSAAVASELAATVYSLKFAKRGIEDHKYNYTRFLVIAKDFPAKTGKDKTSIMFSIKDKVGALYSILKPFAKHKINLTKIESRPSKRKVWEYIFFVDMVGHIEDRNVKKAVNEVKKECLYLKVLGAYPPAE
ncbi:MAG: prephenate dehydratase [Thermodesulfovibrionia bacterium]|nr:prephenate dehydratase [Thermodesulfovibrionia bacterium]